MKALQPECTRALCLPVTVSPPLPPPGCAGAPLAGTALALSPDPTWEAQVEAKEAEEEVKMPT